jgi:putative addiction module component (TIGR02574 family)
MIEEGGSALEGRRLAPFPRGDGMDLQTVLTAVESWPAEDRLRLIERVWDGLAATTEGGDLTESQKLDLQRRLDAYRDNPKTGSTWEVVKARLRENGR